MKISLSIESLQCAYEICLLVKHNSANVIASAEKYEDVTRDKEWYNKAKRFMDAFDTACNSKPERKKYRGNWVKNLQNSLDKLNKSVGDLQEIVEEKI